MNAPARLTEDRLREIVERCLRLALPEGAVLPGEDEDWIASGMLDSMSHVDVLLSIEKALGLPGLFEQDEKSAPRSTRAVLSAIEGAINAQNQQAEQRGVAPADRPAPPAILAGWGTALGSRRVAAGALEREYGLPEGTLRERAGIESVVRASEREDELTLAFAAGQAAMRVADADAGEFDWILATSESFIGHPSLGARLHSRLLLRDTCGVLDVGGACVGLLNCFLAAKGLLAAGLARRVLVVSADIHSRALAAGRVPGEFGGLFGDGASAFVLRDSARKDSLALYHLGEFQFGCAGTSASALAVGMSREGQVALTFEGEALARAAVGRLGRIIEDLELRTGLPRQAAAGFATHQPNPRLVELLARQLDLPADMFPPVAKTCGNLGATTCGVALSRVLESQPDKPPQRGPIFLAAVGPGMLWGGGVLVA